MSLSHIPNLLTGLPAWPPLPAWLVIAANKLGKRKTFIQIVALAP